MQELIQRGLKELQMMRVRFDLERLHLVELMIYGCGAASSTRRIGNNITNTEAFYDEVIWLQMVHVLKASVIRSHC